jgi:hypothetical protein
MPIQKKKERSLLQTFCDCIKKVRETVKLRPANQKKKPQRKQKEKAAIGICVKSVLQTRGKTLKRFSCRSKILKLTKLQRS